MAAAPTDVMLFSDARVPASERERLVRWMRDLEDPLSMQRLQILFSFSVPCPEALAAIAALRMPLLSCGAVWK